MTPYEKCLMRGALLLLEQQRPFANPMQQFVWDEARDYRVFIEAAAQWPFDADAEMVNRVNCAIARKRIAHEKWEADIRVRWTRERRAETFL